MLRLFSNKKNKLFTYAIIWMNLKNMLSESIQKNTYCMISLINVPNRQNL